MTHSSVITAINSRVSLPNLALEDLVNFRYRKERYKLPLSGIEETLEQRGFNSILVHSCEVQAKGTLQIRYTANWIDKDQFITLPVATRFFVSCIRSKESNYKIALCASMS